MRTKGQALCLATILVNRAIMCYYQSASLPEQKVSSREGAFQTRSYIQKGWKKLPKGAWPNGKKLPIHVVVVVWTDFLAISSHFMTKQSEIKRTCL